MTSEPSSSTPLILVSNDDGIHSPGITTLADAMAPLGEVWVVAPDREQSAVGHGISLEMPLRCRERKPRWFAVSGTPADCVYLALFEVLPRRPAVVVSGINRGHNLGDDVLYSGTVAAAIEGCLVGIPSIAVSLGVQGDHAAAGQIARHVVSELIDQGLPKGVLLNLNIPPQLKPGWQLRVARLGERNYQRQVVSGRDPRGRPYYWIGGPEIGYNPIPDTDCTYVYKGEPCLTPLRLDLTDHALLNSLKGWTVARTLRDDDASSEGKP